jgi:predicted methyltransferase MtxX (methanogen marker protein 4)
MKRRQFLTASLGSAFGILLVTSDSAVAGPVRRRRRRVRRRVRRRHRRIAFTRTVFGRPFWVVPVGMVVGWELLHQDRVVVVKETRFVERDNTRIEVAVVQDSTGKTEEIEFVREDSARNRKALEGSVLPADDHSTPGVDDEVEEEVDG